jgi:hypothetical protein
MEYAKGEDANGATVEGPRVAKQARMPASLMGYLPSQGTELQMIKHFQVSCGLFMLQVADKFPETIDAG